MQTLLEQYQYAISIESHLITHSITINKIELVVNVVFYSIQDSAAVI